MSHQEVSPFVLDARGLCKSFGKVTAIQDISLTIAPGECLALLGPNGAGKTTTIEILEGLRSPDKGQVFILGHNLAKERRQVMQSVGVLLQETNLYKRYSVYETFAMFGAFFENTISPDTLIERLSLTEKRNSQLRHLSGGQKQRVGLGCALINDPKLIFLDEPTTGLDPLARRNTWDLILELKKEGKSVLLTTHYMEEAEVLADQVAIMNHGKIVAQGTPKDLVLRFVGGDLLQIECGGDPLEAARKIENSCSWFRQPRLLSNGFEVSLDKASEKIGLLIQEAHQANIEITRVEVRRGTLEDVFLRLTGRSLRDD